MIAVKWSKRGSWHLVRSAQAARTLCGRDPKWEQSTQRAALPGDERTCERCAVIAARTDVEA